MAGERSVEPLLGRAAELSRLRALLDDALSGRPRVAIVSGEPGIGRTALLQRFTDEAARRGACVLRPRSFGSPGAPPYWLWRAALGQPDVVREVGAGADRRTLVERSADRLRRVGSHQGVVLVLDDADQADIPSLAAVLDVVRLVRADRLLVCLACDDDRPSQDDWRAVRAALSNEPVTEELPLHGLGPEDARRALHAVLGGELPEPVATEAFAVTRGNPLHLAELGRWLRKVPRAAWRGPLPGTLDDLVDLRMRALSVRARHVVHAGAVLGERFRIVEVARVLGVDPDDCLEPLDEAVRAGVLSTAWPGPAEFRHGAVRSLVAARIALPELVRLHARAARAIQELGGDQLAERLGVVAHHWSAAAEGGASDEACRWARRAGDDAMRMLAVEEAERLYRVALDNAGSLEPSERVEILLAMAAAGARCGHLAEAGRACREAAETARRLASPRLLAAAALTLEPLGDPTWDGDIHRWCAQALAAPGQDDATRVRLLARLTQASVYCGLFDDADRTSAEALRQADESGDLDLVTEALGARQLAHSGPDDVAELQHLGERMIGVGTHAGRPDLELRGRLWLIDSLWYQGRLAAVAAETTRLQRCADQLSGPYPGWHVLVTRASLAFVRGEFDDAQRHSREAVDLFERLGHPGAHGAAMAFGLLLGHHRGHSESMLEAEAWDFGTDSRWDLYARLGRAFALVDSGRLDEAALLYERCGSTRRWPIPPAGRLSVLAMGVHVAASLGRPEDVAWLREGLLPYRGLYVVGGAGATNFLGPVELSLGRCEAALGRWDAACEALGTAGDLCRQMGAPGFRVEAACELAAVLARSGDPAAARVLVEETRPLARALRMAPWLTRLEALGAPAPDPLTVREREIAGLVAQGLSNRAIARELVISERTAQNHVQHILVKLGFSNRAQIAAWAVRRGPE